MKKSELKHLIKEVLSEDIFLQNRKSPEEKAKTRELELTADDLEYKTKFSVRVYEGDLSLTKIMLPYFKKYSKIEKVTGDFYCMNLNLTSLTEIPIPNNIVGDFACIYNNLTTLKGAPKYVDGDFDCSRNNLITLKGAPEKVGKALNCSHNKLESLKGAPKYVGEHFICIDNVIIFTEEDVRKVCDVKGMIYC